jgi:fucose permease
MTHPTQASDVASPSRRYASNLVLGIGFGLTGAGTVMLGVLLPRLSADWGLRDDAAGLLLFLQFLGSSAGALLSTANRVRSVAIGYALLVAMAAALAFTGPHLAFAVFLFFGLGLGMAMTSTSLLFSDRYGHDRAAVLERLNFAWATGAAAGPLLIAPFLRSSSLRPLYFLLTGLFLLLLLWILVRERNLSPTQSPLRPLQTHAPPHLRVLVPLVVLAMCSVGVESSLSGWLSTYAHRADRAGLGGAAIATSVFWMGLMASRFAFSTRLLQFVGRRRVLLANCWGAAISVGLLIAADTTWSIRVAAAIAGLCVGPLYPLLLSYLLERTPRGWVFAVAGLGSAIFPWLTGALSARMGSLRFGLLAPAAGALLMMTLSSATRRSLSRVESAHGTLG